MSWFIGDDGKEYDIFGRGGAEKMAARMGVPFLGAIPISMALRANSDAGAPLRNFDDPALSSHLDRVVRKLAGQVSVQALTAKTPTLSVS
jgi:ATP-binding protein involved in chromosome partitioning